jgi:hypothetical protein
MCSLEKSEGAGNAGRQCTRSLACKNGKARKQVTTGSPDNTGIPCANGFTAYSVLSLVIGLCCHHRRQNRFRRFDASVGASGPHGFAVRFTSHALRGKKRPPPPAPRSWRSRAAPPWVGQDGARRTNDLPDGARQIFWGPPSSFSADQIRQADLTQFGATNSRGPRNSARRRRRHGARARRPARRRQPHEYFLPRARAHGPRRGDAARRYQTI